MQPQYLSVGDLFSFQRRYVVPLFQRPYVWEEEEQWGPLWDDVRRVADAEASGGTNPPRPHFMGSVVLEQVAAASGHIDRREVIDGQQRLTTLQLLIKATCDILRAAEVSEAAQRLDLLTVNAYAPTELPESKFKVWPTNVDRRGFQRVMEAPDLAALGLRRDDDRLAQAYRFFHGAVKTWIEATPGEAPRHGNALATTLYRHLKVVVLDLDQNDEAQVIFETLNARGTPLLPADLIKNWLLRRAEAAADPVQKLYDAYWKPLDEDKDYWREKIGRGHAARPRIDNFFAYFLAMRRRVEVPASHIYTTFLDEAKETPDDNIEERLKTIHAFADVYRDLDQPKGNDRVARFLQRIKAMDFVTTYPFLMQLFGFQRQQLEELAGVVEAIESWLVRRMVCDLSARGYNTIFIALVKTVAEQADQPLVERVRRFLASSRADFARWPDDAEFREAWYRNKLYRRLTRPRVTMLLKALEEKARTEKIGRIDLPETLEVEHVMPRRWEAHWALPPGEPLDGLVARKREEIVDTIGNLTLVTDKLNKSMSNAAWVVPGKPAQSKCDALVKHALRALTHGVVYEVGSGGETIPRAVWDEAAIMARADTLFADACQLWPSPPQAQT